MANFPSSIPSFTDPSSVNFLNSPPHSVEHATVNDEVVAIATKVGIDSSTNPTSLDYKINHLQTNGWVSTTATLTFGSQDGHTFVINSDTDLTTLISPRNRIKFTNNSTTFYGIVTAITATTITVYGGTNYTVTNSAITNPFYSQAQSPFGFNSDPTIWTETLSDATDQSQGSPVSGTWYNFFPLTLTIPIGIWRVFYLGILQANVSGSPIIKATLSTGNNTESDNLFTSVFDANTGGALNFTASAEKVLNLTVKTQYYLNAQAGSPGVGILGFYGASFRPTIIKAISSYL